MYGTPHEGVAAMSFRMSRREDEVAERRRENVKALAANAPRAIPEPDDRPSPRAQWDEAHGRWVEWDEATDDWRVIEPSKPAIALGSGSAADEVQAHDWRPDVDGQLDDIE